MPGSMPKNDTRQHKSSNLIVVPGSSTSNKNDAQNFDADPDAIKSSTELRRRKH